MIEEQVAKILLNYGSLGIMVVYLMYDRQVVLKRLMSKFDKLTEIIIRGK